MRVFMIMLCSLLAVCSVSARTSRQEETDGQAAIYRLPLMERAFLCCRYFEGWHSEKHHPYVGWGHKLLPNEKYSARTMTKWDADELLRKDLRKFVAMFRKAFCNYKGKRHAMLLKRRKAEFALLYIP